LSGSQRRGAREIRKSLKRSREEIEQIAALVVDAMLQVHRTLEPGMLESTQGRHGIKRMVNG
jgi:hypothetical protein